MERLRRIEDLPGPRGWPLLGNALEIDSTTLHLTAERWAREHGECYRFRIAGRQFVVLANPETIAAVLRERPDGFNRTPRLSAIARDLGFGGLLSVNGEVWRRQRPMVMASFDPGHIKSYFPTLAKVTARFARRWQAAATAGEQIDLQADLMRYTVDVTAGLAFGVDMNTLESRDEVIQTHLDKVLPALFRRLMSPLPYWRWMRYPGERRLTAHLEALQRAIAGFIAQARRRMDADPRLRTQPANLIEAMIAARDDPASGLTDTDVAGNVLTMLLAGEDTTANTLAWMVYLFDRNRAVLERATAEVRGVLGERRQPDSYEQLSRLAYLEACANETMRLKPVAPINTVEAARDTVVAGIHIPRGTLLMCLMRPGGMDERRFPDAAAFDPQRWLGANAAAPKRASMPFGAGPRLCPGRYLAMLEIKMVAAMLLGGFEIDAVATPDGGDAKERLALTMAPVGLRLALHERS
jgi:cytochrome P450